MIPTTKHRKEIKACSPVLILLAVDVIFALSVPAAPSRSAVAEAGRGSPTRARFTDDSRLDQKISLTTWAEPLEDLLARLSRETGVYLVFEGRNVGDQRVNVLLKKQSLRCVQALLADVLGLYWRRERKGATYRCILFQDLRSRNEELDLRTRARERFKEGIRRLADSLKLTPQQIEKLRDQNRWWANWLSDPGRRRAVELVSRLAPSLWDRLVVTGRVEIPFASLSRTDQELVRQYVELANQERDRGDEEHRLLQEEFVPPGFEKEKRNPPPETGPYVTVTWKQKPKRWEEVLKAVAETADLQVISDSYLYHWWEENMKLPEAAALRDRPLEEVLDQVSAPFFYAWRRDGDVTLFRNRNWFLEELHNVPERDLRRWREHLKASGQLGLRDLAEMAPLSRRQLRTVSNAGLPTGSVQSHGSVLRLYAALNPFQLARLEATGVQVRDLDAFQIELLRAWKPAAGIGDGTRLRLRHERDAVVFSINIDGTAPQEERVLLERSAPAGHGRGSTGVR